MPPPFIIAHGNLSEGFTFHGPYGTSEEAADAAACDHLDRPREARTGQLDLTAIHELAAPEEEPCLCGALGPHWDCGVRSPEAQADLERVMGAIAAQIMAAQPGGNTRRARFLQDVVLLMERQGFTGWTPEEGFE